MLSQMVPKEMRAVAECCTPPKYACHPYTSISVLSHGRHGHVDGSSSPFDMTPRNKQSARCAKDHSFWKCQRARGWRVICRSQPRKGGRSCFHPVECTLHPPPLRKRSPARCGSAAFPSHCILSDSHGCGDAWGVGMQQVLHACCRPEAQGTHRTTSPGGCTKGRTVITATATPVSISKRRLHPCHTVTAIDIAFTH